MKHFELHPGGKLVQFEWNSETGAYDQTDVTDHAPRFLWRETRVTSDTTLNDVFLLLEKHIEIFDVVIGNWCKDYVAEALSKSEPDNSLDYVELYWNFTVNEHWQDSNKTYFGGHEFPQFGAIGKDGMNYAIEMTPTYKLKHLPLKLRPNVDLFDEGAYYRKKDYKNPEKYRQGFDVISYTLGDILYGIIWELSFFGDPKNRDNEVQKMNDSIARIESGEDETIPWEEFEAEIRANLKDLE